jgi:hypothetical protein
LNGVRQQGPSQHPLTQLTFTLSVNNLATAIFYAASDDSDTDGLPDWWEDYYFAGPTAGLAGSDSDADGMTNAKEFLAGTDPLSANSVLRLRATGFDAEGFVVRFQSVSNKFYQLERANTLVNSNSWELLQDDIEGTGGWIELVDTNAPSASRRFYRIKVKP